MKQGDGQEVGHPIQRKSFDLTQDPRELRRDGKKAPDLMHGDRSDRRDPEDIMRQMGFDPSKNMTPLQFLIAVMNDDIDAIFKNEKRKTRIEGKGGIAMSYRIEAAKTAAKFMHMELPKVTYQKEEGGSFGEGLAQAIAQGNERIRTRRVIMEEIERISPDVPLAQASYPPDFVPAIESDIIDQEEDYEPDAE